MIRLMFAAVFFMTAFPVGATPLNDRKQQFAKWAAVQEVYPGSVDALGSYDAGCLAGASKIDIDGDGYAIMRVSRKRFYSHSAMNTYLHELGAKLQSMKMPLLLVGDVSPPRGGPMLNGHASHQIGLDADLWLTMKKKRPTLRQRKTWNASSFVIGRKKLRKNWSPTQVNLIATAASFAAVNRIFVSPAIKRYFCQKSPDAEWLYKLRAWWGHEEHVHVRLNCPADAAHCVSQAPLNKDDNGCGTELDWWFSKEADDEWTKLVTHPTPREFPKLPSECDKMVN